MIIAALLAFCATAVLPLVLGRVHLGHGFRANIAMATATPVLLGIVAILALSADPATGALELLVHVLTVVTAVTGGTLLVRGALLLSGIEPWQLDSPAPAPDRADDTPPDPTPLRGGRVIGYLERIAVVAALTLRWPEAIAIVLAVKGLGRYPELRESGAAEQFIIGTLASVMWAAAVAGTGYLLLV